MLWQGKLSLFRVTSAGFALILIVLGVPLTGDSLMRLYASSAVDIDTLVKLAPIDVAANEARLKATDRHFGDPGARIRAGIIERRHAYGSDGPPDSDQLEIASADLSDGLARAPGDDLAWAELAQARLSLKDIEGAKSAWRTSILFGNFEPPLDFWRTEMGLQLWLSLGEDDRRMLYDQINFSWGDDPANLIFVARQSDFVRNVFRDALASDPEKRAAFDKLLINSP